MLKLPKRTLTIVYDLEWIKALVQEDLEARGYVVHGTTTEVFADIPATTTEDDSLFGRIFGSSAAAYLKIMKENNETTGRRSTNPKAVRLHSFTVKCLVEKPAKKAD